MIAALSVEMWLKLPDDSKVKALKVTDGLKQPALEWDKELRNAIFNGRWKSSAYDEYIYYCLAEDGRIVVLLTYVVDIFLAVDYRVECKGWLTTFLDLGVPDNLIGVALVVIDEDTKHDQALHAKINVIEGIACFDGLKIYYPGKRTSKTWTAQYARMLGK